jgi:uncharacterized protein YuzE
MLGFNYESNYDTLYISVGDNSNSYCDNTVNGVNVFRDIGSNEVVGFLIFAFADKYKRDSLPVLPFVSEVNYERDVIPLIGV